ncbi:MAG: hypothetical protein ACRYFZ_19555 [Janthinobacterium lividum]
MNKLYALLLTPLLFTACSAPDAKEEPKTDQKTSFAPDVYTNSLGMVMTNKDKFAYRDLVFTLKPVGGNAVFTLKKASLDTAQRLGLRWVQFTDKQGKLFPKKLMKAEKVTIEVKQPDGKPASTTIDVDQVGY